MSRVSRVAPAKKLRTVPAAKVFGKARRNPSYQKVFDSMEEEFALVASLIRARLDAGMTQEDVAKRMATSQGNIARLETGRVQPSIRTLKRYARATGRRLKISLE